MRKISIILVFIAALPLAVVAQPKERTSSHPHWSISKDVQRMQYKDVGFVPAKITTGDTAWSISKGVHQQSAKQEHKSTGQVRMKGNPSWIISKGVARMNNEKSTKK